MGWTMTLDTFVELSPGTTPSTLGDDTFGEEEDDCEEVAGL